MYGAMMERERKNVTSAVRSTGRPYGRENRTGIPTQLKERMERSTGLSFDDVRVHYNSALPARLDALAYTQGNQVEIGPGQERHLPHELGHVVQQKLGAVRANATHSSGVALNTDTELERQADEIGAGKRVAIIQRMGDNIVQRMEEEEDTSDGPPAAAGEVSGSPRMLSATSELKAHIKYRDWSVPRKSGIGGAHNKEEFNNCGVQIVSTNLSNIPGVEIVQYKIPKLNPDGTLTGEYGAKVFTKTIYDPNIISDEDFIARGMQAANNALSRSRDGILPREWEGVDNEGKRWHGYFQDGNIKSFFPTE